jgi:hypothetical protein
MSNQNKGMLPTYKGLQIDEDMNKKEAEMIETINNILRHEEDTKLINRKTKVRDNFSLPTLDLISYNLERKYYNKNDKKDLGGNVMSNLINLWTKEHKDISVSIDGWLIDKVLDTFRGFVEMLKQRSLSDRFLGRNKENVSK